MLSGCHPVRSHKVCPPLEVHGSEQIVKLLLHTVVIHSQHLLDKG